MKVRLGFVSNSSSSSFVIVTTEKYLDHVVLNGMYISPYDKATLYLRARVRDLGRPRIVKNAKDLKKVVDEIGWNDYTGSLMIPETVKRTKELLKKGETVVIIEVIATNTGDTLHTYLYEDPGCLQLPLGSTMCDRRMF